MLTDWLILIATVALPIFAAINGKRKKLNQPKSLVLFYLKDIGSSAIILVLFFILKPALNQPLDFSETGKGIHISPEIISIIVPVFTIPFFLSFTPWSSNYPKDISAAKELFGYPVSHLPNTLKEHFTFTAYILIGVIFEELLCRQFLFYALNKTLHLSGDILVITAAALFGTAHLYQGWKGVLSNFIMGLFFGKIFLLTGNLVYPIVLHLFLNLTIVVLAFRRIRDLKTNRRLQETT